MFKRLIAAGILAGIVGGFAAADASALRWPGYPAGPGSYAAVKHPPKHRPIFHHANQRITLR